MLMMKLVADNTRTSATYRHWLSSALNLW